MYRHEKNTGRAKVWSIYIIPSVHQENQRLKSSLLNINGAKWTLKTIHPVDTERVQWAKKKITNNDERPEIEVNRGMWNSEDENRVGHINYEYLDRRKLCAEWVIQREVVIEQNSEQCLTICNRDKNKYVTMDETCLDDYTSEYNWQSGWTKSKAQKDATVG